MRRGCVHRILQPLPAAAYTDTTRSQFGPENNSKHCTVVPSPNLAVLMRRGCVHRILQPLPVAACRHYNMTKGLLLQRSPLVTPLSIAQRNGVGIATPATASHPEVNIVL